MFDIKPIDTPEKKAQICNDILRCLPDWFGIETSIVEYVNESQSMPFWVAYDNEKPVGFVALKVHNSYTSEIYVMGILDEYHRHGMGKRLVDCCQSYCHNKGNDFLTVKTLDESAEDESYAKTRKFYYAVGFRPLEVFPLLWSKENPCLFMAKHLPSTR